MIFATADTHYGHKNIIEYCKRPFDSIEEMNETMIDRFNAIVRPGDTTYHLGDFSTGNKKGFESIIEKLNGKFFLIRGRHDNWIKHNYNHPKLLGVKNYVEIDILDIKIIMSHYPMLMWNYQQHGSLMLHGFGHGKANVLNEGTRRMDVGVDSNDFSPISLTSIYERLKNNV